MVVATEYGWGFVLLVLAIPAATWTCALITAYAAIRRKHDWAWLVPAHIPLFISVPLTVSALTRGGERFDAYTLWSYLVPGAMGLLAVAAFLLRRKPPAPRNSRL